MRRMYRLLFPVVLVATSAFAQTITQKFTPALDFAAPIVGSIGALCVIGGIIAKAAGQPAPGNMAIGGGVLFIIATFLMKSYATWAQYFF